MGWQQEGHVICIREGKGKRTRGKIERHYERKGESPKQARETYGKDREEGQKGA